MGYEPPPMRRSHQLLVLLAVGLVLGGAFFVWRQWFQTYHLATVDEGVLYRDGCQSPREFATAIKKVKPKTVVSLIDDRELNDPAKPQFKQEVEYLRQRRIKLEHIPVRLGGWPTEQDVKRFLEVVNNPQNQPVLVHCAQGVRRTGMMVAAYQEAVMKWDDGRAKDAIEDFGHSERTVSDIKRFIEGYDPSTGKV